MKNPSQPQLESDNVKLDFIPIERENRLYLKIIIALYNQLQKLQLEYLVLLKLHNALRSLPPLISYHLLNNRFVTDIQSIVMEWWTMNMIYSMRIYTEYTFINFIPIMKQMNQIRTVKSLKIRVC